VVTRYAHMQAFALGIAPGTSNSAGKSIGKVGHTGRAHGSHVHFDVRIAGRPVDPRHLARCTGVTDASPIAEAEVVAPRVRRRPQRNAKHYGQRGNCIPRANRRSVLLPSCSGLIRRPPAARPRVILAVMAQPVRLVGLG
jgi:murein DD-endopeptidase MepM/ murein hydrolase activator NlpD